MEWLDCAMAILECEALDPLDPHEVDEGHEAVLRHRAVGEAHKRRVTQLQTGYKQQKHLLQSILLTTGLFEIFINTNTTFFTLVQLYFYIYFRKLFFREK
jgi:hypothetical protein